MAKSFFIAAVVPVSAELYCPSQKDFGVYDPGQIQWEGNGFTAHGGMGVASLMVFNLKGGWVEFEIDTSAAKMGVNNNFYLTFPDKSYWKGGTNDCDAQHKDKAYCQEMDIIENNGNCMAQTTWHIYEGKDGNRGGACDQDGCWGQTVRHGTTTVKATFDDSYFMNVYMDGRLVDISNPHPSGAATQHAMTWMLDNGAQLMSSQWTGWVPNGQAGCNNFKGPLSSSSYSVRNIRVFGTVLRGPQATLCSPGPNPGPNPSPPSPTPPSPTPPGPAGQGKCCFWNGCNSCKTAGYCAQSESKCTGVCHGKWCAGLETNGSVVV